MRALFRIDRGVTIASCLGLLLIAMSIGMIQYTDELRRSAATENITANRISRLTAQLLAQTQSVSNYPTESTIRQWRSIHTSLIDHASHAKRLSSQADSYLVIARQLDDMSALFAGLEQAVSYNNPDLAKRRLLILTDRLVAESQQLAEVAYKIEDYSHGEQEKLTTLRRDILIGLLLFFAIALFALLYFIRLKVVAPLRHVEEVANRIRNGKLTARCDLPDGNEIGDVAAALNDLASSLEARIQRLDDVNRTLESEVKEREASEKALQTTLESLKITQMELRQAKEEAESNSHAKGEFLAHLSHEIRTPLNAIVGLISILKQEPHSTNQLELLTKLEGASLNLVALASGVLDVSKIEAGAMELDNSTFSVSELLQSVSDVMTGAAAHKDLALVLYQDPQVPDRLKGDVNKLRQILINLAGNSIKFTEQGQVKVSITADHVDSKRCMLRFLVQDTGIGMDQTMVKSIFRSYAQGDATISKRYGGTGLGLSLSQRLVELMGGNISVASTPGRGSIFSFTLGMDLSTELLGTVQTLKSSYNKTETLKGIKVLAVDDNTMNLFVLRKILENHGAEVVIAENGKAAVKTLSEPNHSGIDVCLMDIQMPEMDGMEACRMIRNVLGLQDLPIIALTAGALDKDHAMAMQSGMNKVLTKPLQVGEVVSTVRLFSQLKQP
jgi:signal transduction histidine kinase/ActR/RegA family two-component response regulator